MEILHILIDLLVWYVKLVKATMPVIQLAIFTFGSLAAGLSILYLVSARRRSRRQAGAGFPYRKVRAVAASRRSRDVAWASGVVTHPRGSPLRIGNCAES